MSTPSANTNGTEPKSREVRLGVVMYGGVSLAIYINGVAREFFEAVRGRGVYRLIKALTDSDIVVDVISGTSAGGINGVMLSYALCNDCDFSTAAELWRMHGDLGRLLRPTDDRDGAKSVLNSETYYQPRLEEVFAGMPRCKADADEDPSAMRELDLFVTSTNVNGAVYTQFDDAGHAIDVKNHRTVFHLKHRAGRSETFAAVPPGGSTIADEKSRLTFKALAKLSRATSCFPAAFAPVRVKPPVAGVNPEDGLLTDWGNLDGECWFLDGGVLDNKPFTYTIKAISSRNAERDVSRKLFYVEPDPECIKPREDDKGPTIVQSVLAALIGIPGYESIADDLKLIGERNSNLERYKRILRGIFSKNIPPPTKEAWGLYIKCRLVSLSERVLTGIFRDKGRDAVVEKTQRDKAASLIRNFDDRSFDDKKWDEGLLGAFDIYFRHRRASRLIYLIHEILYTKQNPAPTAAERIRYRRLLCWLNGFVDAYDILIAAMERVVDEAPIDWKTEKENAVWDTVKNLLLNLLVKTGKDDWAALSPAAFDEALKADAAAGPGADPGKPEPISTCWLTADTLRNLNSKLRDLRTGIVRDLGDRTLVHAREASGTILDTFDQFEAAAVAHFTGKQGPVWLAASDFDKADAYLFPLEMVGGLREKDIIKTVRISPRDAERGFSQKTQSKDKVAGDAVYHFGGFFKRSWRSNDILWGRLDGVCQLIETLLERERIERLTSDQNFRDTLREKLFKPADATGARAFRTELDPAGLFPKAGKDTHAMLREWLTDLVSTAATATAAVEEKRFESITTLLVEAAQLEILHQDFPTVVNDAITEQAGWNLFKVDHSVPKGDLEKCMADSIPGPFTFRAPDVRFDPFFAAIAAEQRTDLVMRRYEDPPGFSGSPMDTRLGKFFSSKYGVGSESLTDAIPTRVLLEILGHTLLVVRNCVLNLFPKTVQARVTAHPLYKFGFDLPLRTFHAAVIVSRRSPAAAILIGGCIAAMSLVALLIGFVWFNSLIRPPAPGGGRTWSWIALLLLIVAPVILLGTGAWLVRKIATRARPQ